MKKSLSYCLIAICLLLDSPLFANGNNQCVSDIASHVHKTLDGNRVLILNNCHLTDSDMAAIVNFVPASSDFSGISLQNNDIGPDGAVYLAKNLSATVQAFFMDNNHIGDAGAIALQKRQSIGAISVAHNDIGDEGATVLCTSSISSPINLSDNPISAAGLFACIKDQPLDLAARGLSFNQDSINAVIQSVAFFSFDFSNTNLSTSDINAILAKNPGRRSLGLSGLPLDDKSLTYLVSSIINFLDISSTNISANAVAAFMADRTVAKLNLANNHFTDVDMAVISNGITTTRNVLSTLPLEISLDGNQDITIASILNLAKVLDDYNKNNIFPLVVILHIDGTKITAADMSLIHSNFIWFKSQPMPSYFENMYSLNNKIAGPAPTTH